mmetsp:Transcript_19981/g.31437  ORF Transcript_19981/g.31437 Transcript_19981/m.31437 type:complete len:87 (+) Transcript_19981:1842-2102(+)
MKVGTGSKKRGTESSRGEKKGSEKKMPWCVLYVLIVLVWCSWCCRWEEGERPEHNRWWEHCDYCMYHVNYFYHHHHMTVLNKKRKK